MAPEQASIDKSSFGWSLIREVDQLAMKRLCSTEHRNGIYQDFLGTLPEFTVWTR